MNLYLTQNFKPQAPNQALQTTIMAVTECAVAHSAPATIVSDL
jgi:hypothetical protein